MKLLTPREALRAIADGEKLEYRKYGETEWYPFRYKDSYLFINSILRECYTFRLAEEPTAVWCARLPKPRLRILTHLKRLFKEL